MKEYFRCINVCQIHERIFQVYRRMCRNLVHHHNSEDDYQDLMNIMDLSILLSPNDGDILMDYVRCNFHLGLGGNTSQVGNQV